MGRALSSDSVLASNVKSYHERVVQSVGPHSVGIFLQPSSGVSGVRLATPSWSIIPPPSRHIQAMIDMSLDMSLDRFLRTGGTADGRLSRALEDLGAVP